VINTTARNRRAAFAAQCGLTAATLLADSVRHDVIRVFKMLSFSGHPFCSVAAAAVASGPAPSSLFYRKV